ncbi:cyclic nucleotide-binding domain-containing protein [bacterium]|jgi:CRP-like cAMP-binding protein|nr:cyclic nucleotide-binding domain-containing protein [bacterium]
MVKAKTEILTKTFDLYPEDSMELGLLCKFGIHRTFRAGYVFINEGEEADKFYVIVTGNVRISVQAGESQVTIYTAQPGEIVGFSSLVEPRLYKGTATAVSTIEVLEFRSSDLQSKMQTYPRLGYIVMYRVSQFLSQRLLHSMFETMSEIVSH